MEQKDHFLIGGNMIPFLVGIFVSLGVLFPSYKVGVAAGGRINNSNNFIFTIKQVRVLTGMGLKESKELVESW